MREAVRFQEYPALEALRVYRSDLSQSVIGVVCQCSAGLLMSESASGTQEQPSKAFPLKAFPLKVFPLKAFPQSRSDFHWE